MQPLDSALDICFRSTRNMNITLYVKKCCGLDYKPSDIIFRQGQLYGGFARTIPGMNYLSEFLGGF